MSSFGALRVLALLAALGAPGAAAAFASVPGQQAQPERLPGQRADRREPPSDQDASSDVTAGEARAVGSQTTEPIPDATETSDGIGEEGQDAALLAQFPYLQAPSLPAPDIAAELASRASFTRGSARLAAEALDRDPIFALDAGMALYTLGAGGAVSEQVRLEEAARFGRPEERAGALLGLGELPDVPLGFLSELRRDSDPLVGACAGIALAMHGERGWSLLPENNQRRYRQLVEEPLAVTRVTEPSPAAFYLGLRAAAARRFGLVDGRDYRAARALAVALDPEFLDDVVLDSVAENHSRPMRDHLMALIMERSSPAAVGAAVSSMPLEMDALVRNGIWLPADDAEWDAVLDSLEARGADPGTTNLLEQSQARSSHAVRAAALLLALDLPGGFEVIEPQLRSGDPQERSAAARALGATGDDAWLIELERLETDSNAAVRVAATLARVELGDSVAFELATTILADSEHDERPALLAELLEYAQGARSVQLLDGEYERLDDDVRLPAAIRLVRNGRRTGRDDIRQALDQRATGQLTRDCVEALAILPDGRDLERFARIFPSDDTLLDATIARALIENDHSLGRQFIRAAVWAPDFQRGILAAHLLANSSGLAALRQELEAPPERLRQADLRRVGFALGELGGVAEVERLALARTSHDPVLQGAYLGALSARTR